MYICFVYKKQNRKKLCFKVATCFTFLPFSIMGFNQVEKFLNCLLRLFVTKTLFDAFNEYAKILLTVMENSRDSCLLCSSSVFGHFI